MAEHIKASLFACALGEAYGAAFAASEMPMRGPRWTIGPNTQLMLATCEGILNAGELSLESVRKSILDWYSRGWIMNPEPATLMALLEISGGRGMDLTSQNGAAGFSNGAVIRTAVAGWMLDTSSEKDKAKLKEICAITHRTEEAYSGALAVVLAMRLIRNERQNFLPVVMRAIPLSGIKDRLEAIAKTPDITLRDIGRRFGASANVVDSISLALFATQQFSSDGLPGVLKEVVKAGGEFASNCAISGMITGYCLGMENIPREWIDRLRDVPGFSILDRISTDFEKLVEGKKGVVTLF